MLIFGVTVKNPGPGAIALSLLAGLSLWYLAHRLMGAKEFDAGNLGAFLFGSMANAFGVHATRNARHLVFLIVGTLVTAVVFKLAALALL